MTTTTDSTLLAQVQACIAQALAGLDAREGAAGPPPAAPTEASRPVLDTSGRRIAGLQVHAQQVAERLHEVDSPLHAEENNLRAFLANAAALRQKLAAWTGRAIG